MFENLKGDLARYTTTSGSPDANSLPPWFRVLVRVIFRVEVHATIVYRYGNWAYYLEAPPGSPFKKVMKMWRFLHRGIHYIVAKIYLTISGIYLPPETQIGPGLFFPHPGPIYFSGDSIIGTNLTVYPCVVIGGDHSRDGSPMMGDNVVLGAGSKVLGPVKLGSNVIVGANSVVVKDVPSDAVAVGVPAVVKKRIWAEKRADGSYEMPPEAGQLGS